MAAVDVAPSLAASLMAMDFLQGYYWYKKILVKFAVPAECKGAIVSEAVLSLYEESSRPAALPTTGYACAGDWATGDGAAALDALALGDAQDAPTVSTATGWKTWDLTSAVAAICLAGETWVTAALVASVAQAPALVDAALVLGTDETAPDDAKVFTASGEHAPKLSITYAPATGGPYRRSGTALAAANFGTSTNDYDLLYWRFDLPALPVGSRVTGATLVASHVLSAIDADPAWAVAAGTSVSNASWTDADLAAVFTAMDFQAGISSVTVHPSDGDTFVNRWDVLGDPANAHSIAHAYENAVDPGMVTVRLSKALNHDVKQDAATTLCYFGRAGGGGDMAAFASRIYDVDNPARPYLEIAYTSAFGRPGRHAGSVGVLIC